jgi:hypothetical protein
MSYIARRGLSTLIPPKVRFPAPGCSGSISYEAFQLTSAALTDCLPQGMSPKLPPRPDDEPYTRFCFAGDELRCGRKGLRHRRRAKEGSVERDGTTGNESNG